MYFYRLGLLAHVHVKAYQASFYIAYWWFFALLFLVSPLHITHFHSFPRQKSLSLNYQKINMKSAALMLAGLTSLTVAGPMNGRQANQTKEELCVGFNNNFEACRSAVLHCAEKLKADGQGFSWEGVSRCLEGRRPGASKPGAAASPPTSTNVQAAFKADIRADTNRDGVVDVQGSSDTEGKDRWTEQSGAIFLANIGDSGGRCKQSGPSKDRKTPIETLAKCHDADDDEQRAPKYMAPMRTVPIHGLSKSATASVTVSDAQVRPLVRIFRARGDGSWEIVNNDTVFSAEDVEKGLTLGIDARDTRRAGGWDGRVSVDFTIKDGEAMSKDTVMLRVAPVLMHHHRQPIQTVFASSFPDIRRGQTRSYIDGLVKGIEGSMQKSQVPGPITLLSTMDPWAQDFFEPGYTSMPGANGEVISLRVVMEGRRNHRDSVRLLYTNLRGDGVGALEAMPRGNPGLKDDTFQAGGNMETIPPYSLNGKKFPAGRVVVGGDGSSFPRAVDFFRAQEMQEPIVLDSTWLFIKHIDEMIQFLPAKTERGWSMVAVDPQLGWTLLGEAQKRGYGSQPVINREKVKSSPTVDEFLASQSNKEAVEISAKRMEANIQRMKEETGITDAEIFRMPMLVGVAAEVHNYLRPSHKRSVVERRDNETSSAPSAEEEALAAEFLELIDIHGPGGDSANDTTTVERRQSQPSKPVSLESYLPSLVNGVPLSDSHYLAPKPFGPLIDGRDMFEIVASNVYKKAGFTVDFHDDWLFHSSSGDLHCMTNTFRDTSTPWW